MIIIANGIVVNNKTSNQLTGCDDVVNAYLEELKSVVSSYDYLGSVRYEEYEEYNSTEHDFFIENLEDLSPQDLIPTIKAIDEHMKKFSKSKGILKFYLSSFILFE